MLLDEPFGALDPVTRDSLQSEFKCIQRELGLTAVIVTHDMAEAMLLADRIAIMNEGEILRVGTAAELLDDPGHDYVAALLATPRRHGELVRAIESGERPPSGSGSDCTERSANDE
jgi:osmoprotectant transport system ATP-binding protein